MAGALPQHVIIPNGLDSLHPLLDRQGLCTYCDVRWPIGGPIQPTRCPPLTGPLGIIANNSFVVCPNISRNHLPHPNPAAASFNRWYIMCTRARNDLKAHIIPQAQEVFGRPIIEKMPDGTVSKINYTNNIGGLGPGGLGAPTHPNMPQRSMSYLCRICTADEVRHYVNRISNDDYAIRYPHPEDAENGFENTCTCINQCIRSNDPENARQADCGVCTRFKIEDRLTSLAMIRREFVRRTTHARGGVRMFADNTIDAAGNPGLIAQRDAADLDIPCRCGRDAIAPVENPKVLWCLACEGVKIDSTQVRLNRTRNEVPTMPLNIAYNWPVPTQVRHNPQFRDDFGAAPSRTVYNGRY